MRFLWHQPHLADVHAQLKMVHSSAALLPGCAPSPSLPCSRCRPRCRWTCMAGN